MMFDKKDLKSNKHDFSFGGKSLKLFVVLILFTCSFSAAYATNFINEATSDSAKIYTVVDEMPEIKGGLSSIYEHIEYPRQARLRGVEGRVYVKFIVDESGNVKKPEVLKDIGSGCGDAAIEGIKNVKFIPGKQNGKAVQVYFTMPINFKLEKG